MSGVGAEVRGIDDVLERHLQIRTAKHPWPYCQHRTLRVVCDRFRNRTHHEPVPSLRTVRANYDQIDIAFVRNVSQLLCDPALNQRGNALHAALFCGDDQFVETMFEFPAHAVQIGKRIQRVIHHGGGRCCIKCWTNHMRRKHRRVISPGE